MKIMNIRISKDAKKETDIVCALVEILLKNRSLLTLNLQGYLSLASMNAIVDALAKNQTLTSLNLSTVVSRTRSFLSPKDVYESHTSFFENSLPNMLSANRTLTELNLANNGIDHRCLRPCIKALQENTTLNVLDIRHNNLENVEGIRLLISLLKVNKTLNIIDGFVPDPMAHDQCSETQWERYSIQRLNEEMHYRVACSLSKNVPRDIGRLILTYYNANQNQNNKALTHAYPKPTVGCCSIM